MNETVDLKKEINSATKQAQRYRQDKHHEATVLLCKIPYEEAIVNTSSDATIRKLTTLRYSDRREVAVLAHPETAYRPADDADPTVADDEAETAPNEPRPRRNKIKRHNTILVTKRVFNLFARKRRVPKSYNLAHTQTRNQDTTSFLGRNMVTLNEVMDTIASDPIAVSDDENSQTSQLADNQSIMSRDAFDPLVPTHTEEIQEDTLTEVEDGEIVNAALMTKKRVSFDPALAPSTSSGNTVFRHNIYKTGKN